MWSPCPTYENPPTSENMFRCTALFPTYENTPTSENIFRCGSFTHLPHLKKQIQMWLFYTLATFENIFQCGSIFRPRISLPHLQICTSFTHLPHLKIFSNVVLLHTCHICKYFQMWSPVSTSENLSTSENIFRCGSFTHLPHLAIFSNVVLYQNKCMNLFGKE